MRKIAVRRVRAAGRVALESGRAALERAIGRCRLDRARLAAADALRAAAPAGAGYVAVLSFPAALLAFAATGSFGAKGGRYVDGNEPETGGEAGGQRPGGGHAAGHRRAGGQGAGSA